MSAVGCSTPVTLAFNPNTEKNVPLDTRAPVYRVVGFDFDGTPRVEIASGFFVSHFSTCQHADQFSKQRRSK